MKPTTLTTLLLVCGLLASGALLALPATSLAQHEQHHAADKGKQKAEAKQDKAAEDKMAKHMMSRMKTMAQLKETLQEAKGAAESQEANEAVAKIDEALQLIEKQHKGMHAMMKLHMRQMHGDMMKKHKGMMDNKKMSAEKMKCPMCGKMIGQTDEDAVVNVRCPIMGNKIDSNDVPEKLTREWKGKTVAFCCAACPPTWDKLSDEEKQEKLKAAMAKTDKTDASGGHEGHHGD